MAGTGFWVDPQALQEFAARLEAMSGQFGDAAQYVKTALKLPPASNAGVINVLAREHSKIQQAAQHACTRLDDLFAGSGTSMAKAAYYYETTDLLIADHIDQAYPVVKAPGHPSHPGRPAHRPGADADRNRGPVETPAAARIPEPA